MGMGSAVIVHACGGDNQPEVQQHAVEHFSAEFLAASREEAFNLIASAVRDEGRDSTFVLEGVHLAAATSNDDRVGGRAHSIYGVVAADSVGVRIESPWLALLWAADDVKRWQAELGRVPIGPLDEVVPSAAHAHAAFLEAIVDRDLGAAERAIVGVMRGNGAEAARAAIHDAALHRVFAGAHNTIRVLHGLRALDRTGWGPATEHTLRMIARGLAEVSTVDIAPREDLIAMVPPSWQDGAYDLSAALTLLDVLQSASSDDAQQAVADVLASGVNGESLWQAAFMLGPAFVTMYEPNTLARHQLTSADAHRAIYDAAENSDDRLRALFLTFANAAHAAEIERAKFGLEPRPERLLELSAQPGTSEQAWATSATDPLSAVSMMLDVVGQNGAEAVLAQALSSSVEAMGDAHRVKFPLAIAERFAQIDPTLTEHYLAALYVANGAPTDAPAWERLEEARDLQLD